jgi:hypothetical protein
VSVVDPDFAVGAEIVAESILGEYRREWRAEGGDRDPEVHQTID